MRFPLQILLCAIAATPTTSFLVSNQCCRINFKVLKSQGRGDVQIDEVVASNDVALESPASTAFSSEFVNDQDDHQSTSNNILRKRWHNWMRDSGGVRLFMDTATRLIAAPQFYQEYPHCFPDFVRISGSEYSWLLKALRALQIVSDEAPDVHFSKESYGNHPLQVAQVMVHAYATPKDDETKVSIEQQQPLFFFVHGGAWGSGFPTMYRLMSVPFLQRGFRAVILGYRTYPDGKVEEQVEDIVKAIEYFGNKYGSGISGDKPPVVLMGHSSGAHISLLAALQGKLPSVDAIIAASGVYNCQAQVERERSLDIDQLSPLSPAAGMSEERMQENSPSWIVSKARKGDIKAIPPVLLVHGNDDSVVLPSSSQLFYEQLKESGVSSKPDIRLLDGTGHQDPVVDTLVGGETQSVIFEWLENIVKIR